MYFVPDLGGANMNTLSEEWEQRKNDIVKVYLCLQKSIDSIDSQYQNQ